MNKYIRYCFILLTVLSFTACQSELDIPMTQGSLQITLDNISPLLTTRSTPSELGKPEASNFKIKVTKGNGTVLYHKDFTEERIPLPAGQYEVTAFCGENPLLAPDAPYYSGTQRVNIVENEVTKASIDCRVANALVSVRFGRNEAERARFDKFYQTYGVKVMLDRYSCTIYNYDETSSIYFRAGSSVNLMFVGKLKADGREVSTSLDMSSSTFPSIFQAADHAIVTLSLPEAESATAVEISKVEMEEASMEETIPLSWLPIPQVTPAHHYNMDGNLQGTDLIFSNAYPGMTWKVDVTDNIGTICRSVQGTGELTSDFSDNLEGQVFLPAGAYNATFYLVRGEESIKTGSRTFNVDNPNLKVSTSAYTSYSKYLAGLVDEANACKPYTIYQPVVSVNIAPELWNNSKYAKSMTVSLGGETLADASLSNDHRGVVFNYSDQTREPNFEAYALIGNVTFAGANVSGQSGVYITGLPASWTPPTKDDWSANGTHDWEDTYNNKNCVRLGRNTTSQPQYIICHKFAVPAGIKIEAPYDVMMHGATEPTVLTLSFGDNTYLTEKSSSGIFNSKDHDFTDIARFTTGAPVSEAKANNSYGSGQTCSRIYSLTYKYGK